METRLLAEIESLLQRDATDLGKVWRMSRQGVEADAMAQRLQCTPGHVNNVQMQISVLRGEPLPSAPSRRLKAAQKIGGWLESKPLTPALESHLKGLRTTLRGHTDVVDHPTVEWVKRPVSLATGLPTGQPIRRRHLPDGCLHFYPDPQDASKLLGGPFRLATLEEMKHPACDDCIRTAQSLGHPRRGERDAVPDQGVDDQGGATAPVLAVTDGRGSAVVRREQSYLRRHLLAGRTEAPCGLCGLTLPVSLLVAAHIVPRHALGHAERLDFTAAAFLACRLGCDALFEDGYVVVDAASGTINLGQSASGDVARAVQKLVNRQFRGLTPRMATQFARHAALHVG